MEICHTRCNIFLWKVECSSIMNNLGGLLFIKWRHISLVAYVIFSNTIWRCAKEEKTFQINMSEDSSLFTHNLSDGGGWEDKSILVDKDCQINFKLDPLFFLILFSSLGRSVCVKGMGRNFFIKFLVSLKNYFNLLKLKNYII